MSQNSLVVADGSGASVLAALNNALNALVSQNSGAGAPGTSYAYQLWADTTNGVIKQRNAANTAWIVRAPLAEALMVARAANTALAVGDFGRIILASGTWTQTLNACSTLGDGWVVEYRNDGTGTITIDPNASELIDGATTVQLAPGETCCLYCDGTQIKTIGRSSPAAQTQAATAFTSAGTAPAFTLTPAPAIAAYAANQRFRVKFHAAGTTGSNTLNVSALGAKNLMQYDSTGTKVSAVVAASQLADVEYDGTDMVLIDPLPPSAAAGVPVRQTVLGGPVDTSGFPSFFPATSASLSLTSQNVSGSAPFVVAAANGFGASGGVDRVGNSTANLTWSGLTASATNYLYVDVASNGVLTPGSTILAPTYQFGGTRSTTNGQATFNTQEMSMTVGNGSSAVQTYRVFVGEAVTNASTVTSTTAYAYQGKYDSGWTTPLPGASTSVSKNSNLGTKPIYANVICECITADGGYSAGDQILNDVTGGAWGSNTDITNPIWVTANTVGFSTGATNAMVVGLKGGGGNVNMTAANWKYKLIANRGW